MEKLEMQVIHIIGCEKPKEMLVINQRVGYIALLDSIENSESSFIT